MNDEEISVVQSDALNPIHVGSIMNDATLLKWPSGVFISGNYAYVASSGSNALEIIDISSPANPVRAGSLLHGEGGAELQSPRSVYISGNYAYVACAAGSLEIVNVSIPTNPIHAGSILNGAGGAKLDFPSNLHVSGNYAYITSINDDALEIIDISQPSAPVHVGSIVDGVGGAKLDYPVGIFVSGNYAYVASAHSNALEIVNISIPSAPIHVSSIVDNEGGANLSEPTNVFVSGNYAYVASGGSDAIEIVDVSNPATPLHAGCILNHEGGALLDGPSSVFVNGTHAFVASSTSNALEIIDVSNPSSPLHISSIVNGEGGAKLGYPVSVYVSDSKAFVVNTFSNNLEIIDVANPSSPLHISSIENGVGGAKLGTPESVSISGNYAYLVSSSSDALEIIDISNPTTPIHSGSIVNGSGGAHIYQPMGVDISGYYAYIASGFSNALEVVDISNPSVPIHAGSILNGSEGAKLDYPHDVFVSGNYAYLASAGSNALEIVDISNPHNPIHTNDIEDGEGGAILNWPTSVFISGNYAYITGRDSDSLEIVNITDPKTPTHEGSIVNGTNGAKLSQPRDVFVDNNFAYVASAGSNALEIINVSNPRFPVHSGSITSGEGGALLAYPNGVYVLDKYAYVASMGNNALEIIDISDPTAPLSKGRIINGEGGAKLLWPSKVFVSDNYAYIASKGSNALEIIHTGISQNPSIFTIHPSVASNASQTSFQITGSNFQSIPVPTVNLTKTVDGFAHNITATNVTVPDSGHINGTIDITGAVIGKYDLFVQNGNGLYAKKIDAFEITGPSPYAPKLITDSVSEITPTSALLKGHITNQSPTETYHVCFRYEGANIFKTKVGYSTASLEKPNYEFRLTGLNPGTTYTYQAVHRDSTVTSPNVIDAVNSISFTTASMPAPIVNRISPNYCKQGESQQFTIFGNNFQNGAKVSLQKTSSSDIITTGSTIPPFNTLTGWLAVPPSATPGEYSVVVTQGGVSSDTNVKFTVETSIIITPPSPPLLLKPGTNSDSGIMCDSLTPTFEWLPAEGVIQNNIMISRGNQVVYSNSTLKSNLFTLPPEYSLEPDTKYNWKMNSENSAGFGPLSSGFYFITPPKSPPKPELYSITPSSFKRGDMVSISIQGKNLLDYGTISLKRAGDFDISTSGRANSDRTSLVGSLTIPSNAATGDWDVIVIQGGVRSTNSLKVRITGDPIQSPVISPPILVSPENGVTGSLLSPTFTWKPVSGAEYYALYIIDSRTNNQIFDSTKDYGQIYQTYFSLPISLDPEVTFYWKMKSYSNGRWSEQYSDTRSFTTRKSYTLAEYSGIRVIQPMSAYPGDTVRVSVVITCNVGGVLVLTETVPSGWTITPVSSDATRYFNGNWIWQNVDAGNRKIVTYDLSIPPNTLPREYQLYGLIGKDENLLGEINVESTKNTVPVGGHPSVNVKVISKKPKILKVEPDYNGPYLPEVSWINKFVVTCDPESDPDYLIFSMNGDKKTIYKTSYGWFNEYDMGALPKNSILEITGYRGEWESDTYVVNIQYFNLPWWQKEMLKKAHPTRLKTSWKYIDLSIPEPPWVLKKVIYNGVPGIGGEWGAVFKSNIMLEGKDGGIVFGVGGNIKVILASATEASFKVLGKLKYVIENSGQDTINGFLEISGELLAPVTPKYSILLDFVESWVSVGPKGTLKINLYTDSNGNIQYNDGSGQFGGIIKIIGKSKGDPSIEITGDGGGGFNFGYMPVKIESVYGEIGGTIKFVSEIFQWGDGLPLPYKWTAEKDINWPPERPWYIPSYVWPWKQTSNSRLLKEIITGSSAAKENKWRYIPRDYVNTNYGLFNEKAFIEFTSENRNNGNNQVNSTIVSNVFPYASPMIAYSLNNNLLVWTHDNISKPEIVGLNTYYSFFDGVKWQNPKEISPDNYPDISPNVEFDKNGNAIASWIRCNNSTISTDFPLEKIRENYEIFYSLWNNSSKLWSPSYSLTKNSHMDYGLSLNKVKNGLIYAGWYDDLDNSIFTLSDRNILSKSWDGNLWSDIQVIAKNRKIIVPPEISEINGIIHSFWVEGEEDDAPIPSQNSLFYSSYNGNYWSIPVALSQINGNIRNPSIISLSEKPFVIWVERDGSSDDRIMISEYNSGWSIPAQLLSYPGINELNVITDPTQNTIITWQGPTNMGQNVLYTVRNDFNNKWSGINLLTNTTDIYWQLSTSISPDGSLIQAYVRDNLNVTDSNITESGHDLAFSIHPILPDISMDQSSISCNPLNPNPGENLDIQVKISNIGDISAQNIHILMKDSSTNTIISQTTIPILEANTSTTLHSEWVIPHDDKSHVISVIIDPENDLSELRKDNNQAWLSLITPDLSIYDSNITFRKNTGYITFNQTITNDGKITASNVQFRSYLVDEDDDNNHLLVSDSSIPLIEPGESHVINNILGTTRLHPGIYNIYSDIDPYGAIKENNRTNNVASTLIRIYSDLMLSADNLTLINEPDGRRSILADIYNNGLVPAQNITVGLYHENISDSNFLDSKHIDEIFVGNSSSVLFPLNTSWNYNGYYVYIDPHGYVNETDKSNNVALKNMTGMNRPIVDFSASVTSGLSPLYVTFTDLSSGNPQSRLWNFGDGEYSEEKTPNKIYYYPGNYTVELTVLNEGNVLKKTKYEYISVFGESRVHTITAIASSNGTITPSGSISVPEGSDQTFTITPNPDFYIHDVQVDNQTVGAVAKYIFRNVTANHTIHADFTDVPGQYEINATADSWSIVHPSGNISYPVGTNKTYITQAKPGADLIDVIVDDESEGNISNRPFKNISSDHQIETIGTPSPGQIHVDFNATPISGKAPLEVAFHDLSIGDPTSWLWQFGDGGSSTEKDPIHQYTPPGTYTVSLRAYNDQTGGYRVMNDYIMVTK